jgi:cytochrome c-type biogenesis protein CcmH/NrfG
MQLAPQSTGAQLEYATALLKLDEDQYGTEATRILRQLAATEPLDALERIDIELAIAAAA